MTTNYKEQCGEDQTAHRVTPQHTNSTQHINKQCCIHCSIYIITINTNNINNNNYCYYYHYCCCFYYILTTQWRMPSRNDTLIYSLQPNIYKKNHYIQFNVPIFYCSSVNKLRRRFYINITYKLGTHTN